MGNDRLVHTDGIGAEALAQVAVQVNFVHRGFLLYRINSERLHTPYITTERRKLQ